MAYTLNRRLSTLVDSNGQLNTGKISNDYITSDHIADNVITSAMLHTSFTVSTSNLTAIDTDDVSEGSSNLYYTDARAQAVSINNVVEDTTPQLGGDLGANGNLITFGDSSGTGSNRLKFGASSDLQIYHDGNHSYVQDTGAGDLRLLGNNLQLKNGTATENYLTATENAGVSVYYDNAIKLATTSTGIDVTGTATMDGLTVDGDTTFNTSSDGSFVDFSKNNTTVGNIGTIGSHLTIGTSDVGIRFHAGTKRLIPFDVSTNSATNGTISLGSASVEFNELHLSGTANFGSLSDGTITITAFVDEDNMVSNSATLVPTQQSIKAYVDTQVAGVVDSAPAALDTLNELAAALGDDANFSTTTSTALGNRLRVDTASQGLTGTQQANAITNLGITATKAELNYVDGVTSSIQTQLDTKITSSDNITGTSGGLSGTPDITVGDITATQLDLRGEAQTSNLDTVGRGLYYWGTTQPSTGSPGWNYGVAWTVRDSSQNIQLAFGSSSAGGRLAVRRANSGTYYDWGHFYGEGTTISGDVSSSYNQSTNTLTLTVADDSHNHTIANVDGLQTALDAKLASSSYTAADVLTKIKTVDGAGSGLDADTIDGISSASFLRSDTGDSWNVGRGDVYVEDNSSDNTSGSGITLRTSNNPSSGDPASVGNIFAIRSSGQALRFAVGQSITSTGDNDFTTNDLTANGNITVTGTVDGRDIASDGSKLDGIESSATADQTAAEILTAIKTVDGAGSGLDADLLDGISSASFLRSDTDDAVTNTGVEISFYSNEVMETSSGDQATLEVYQDTAGADAFMQFHVAGDYAGYFGIKGDINDFAVGGWSYGSTYHRVWHAGNDGAGSGLDADLLDGLGEDTFMRRSANSQLDMNNNDIVGVDQIFHEGDSNTYMQFHAADQWRVVTGGSERLEANNTRTTVNNGYLQVTGSTSHLVTTSTATAATTRIGLIAAHQPAIVFDTSSTAVTGARRIYTIANMTGNRLRIGNPDFPEALAINNDGIVSTSGSMTVGNDLTVSGGNITTGTSQQRVKVGVWSNTVYGIGMQAGYTFGGITNEYVLTNQMSDTNGRGFWWGDSVHTNAQGAMALTTQGYLTVANRIRVGYGESDTTTPSKDLDVSGEASIGSLMVGATTTPAMQLQVKDTTNYHGILVNGNAAPNVCFDKSTGTTPEWKVGISGNDGSKFAISKGTINDDKLTIDSSGNAAVSGNVTAYSSDERLKTNITRIENPIEKVKQLNGVEFDWKDNVEELGFTPRVKHETGVIAQNVQSVIPDATPNAPFNEEYLTVQHEKIIPVLIEAIKEQQKQIDDLKQQINEKKEIK